MTNLKYTFVFVFALILFSGYGQQMQQKIEMRIDSIGNAKVAVSMNMNAQEWQSWLAGVGSNPAILKREIERSMPTYFLDDFDLKKNDMERSFSLTFKAYGVCNIDKRGNWILETDQKNANLTELTEHKYMLVSSPPEFGGTMQQTFIVEFPKAAHNIDIDKDAFGESVFKFKMKDSSSGINYLRWAGIALIVVGGALSGKNLMSKKSV